MRYNFLRQFQVCQYAEYGKCTHEPFLKSAYCWFARDITAAMLGVKNKSIFLLWELNSIFM